MYFENTIEFVIFARVIERAVIVLAILSCTFFLMRFLGRESQQIDLDIDTKAGAAKASMTIAMPVFLVLVLVMFAFVAFSNPVTIRERTDIGHPSQSTNDTGPNREIEVVGYDGLNMSDLQTVRAINTLSNSLAELQNLRGSNFDGASWEGFQPTFDRMLISGLRLLEHRNALMEAGFGQDVLMRCRQQIVLKGVDESTELSEICKQVYAVVHGEI